ncbi:MAG: hypothetical protein AAGE98_11545 [Actinomycetota bacterium]
MRVTVVAIVMSLVVAGCSSAERPSLSAPSATTTTVFDSGPIVLDPSVDITFFGFPFGMEAALAAMAPNAGGGWDVRPGEGRGVCAALEQGLDAALFAVSVEPPAVPCDREVRAIGTRAVYVYASDDVPTVDVDLLRRVFVEPGAPPHRAIGTDVAEWEWVIHELLASDPPPPDRLVLEFDPGSIRAAVEAGDTIAYSAFIPELVGRPARCVAPAPDAPCVDPDDRTAYPLQVPVWFAATSDDLFDRLVASMLSPEIVERSAEGGVVIDG